MLKWKELIVAIIICQFAGVVGSLFTFSSIPTWYATLSKPSFSPPNWVFGPVWTLLYTSMGISIYWVYNSKNKGVKSALYIFGIQLMFNVLWSIVFFGLKSPLYGLIVILFLWTSIVMTIWKFYHIDRRSGYILFPYLIWVSFATLLNYYIFLLN
ncbi:MAG: TspO/MBR family protein [Candidatus Bilamarchaeum sp.]